MRRDAIPYTAPKGPKRRGLFPVEFVQLAFSNFRLNRYTPLSGAGFPAQRQTLGGEGGRTELLRSNKDPDGGEY